MSVPLSIETDRLILRRWRDADVEPFVEMNADPKVMEFFPDVMTVEETQESVERYRRHFDDHGFGFWVAELKGSDSFAGVIGMAHTRFDSHFTPAVEVGWRLAAKHWGNGYAPEGALAAIDFAFRYVGLKEVVAMTAAGNLKSRRVMEKIGMTRDAKDDFDHPLVPSDHFTFRHVLYRIVP